MKPIIIVYFLCIVLSIINSVFSSSNQKSRLLHAIRQSMKQNDEQALLNLPTVKDSSSSSSTFNKDVNPIRNTRKQTLHGRDSSDAHDGFYFKWASLKRGPMESLARPKRNVEQPNTTPKPDRIKSGFWLSGLVG